MDRFTRNAALPLLALPALLTPAAPAAADILVYDAISSAVTPAAVFVTADRRYADDTFLPAGSPLTLTGLSFEARNGDIAPFSGTFTARLYADTGATGNPAGPGAVLATITIPLTVPGMSNISLHFPLNNLNVPTHRLWTGWEADHTGPGVANLFIRGSGGAPPAIGSSEDLYAFQPTLIPGTWTMQANGAATWGGPEYTYTHRISITAVPAPASLALLLAGAAMTSRRARHRDVPKR